MECEEAVKRRHDKLIARALSSLESRARKPGIELQTESVCGDWFRLKLASYEREVFAVGWLDLHHRLIAFEELSSGTIDGTVVSVREVVKSALRHNASAAIFAHNHPCGSTTASSADLALTDALIAGLALVDVRFLDHFIVTAHHRPISLVRLSQQLAKERESESVRISAAKKAGSGSGATPRKHTRGREKRG
jgi:DNA repair protein RadC